ncbi:MULTISPECIES: winged helix-turn-helix domain-containing protein [unclassified Paraburkholderia]|uniref:winged helix-turn-helix domain-containing protein n=1 Tax=unclassified Paraburkholderia TaxID=2615204 RepID=UPI001620DC57|nr:MULTISPECIES: winged helix-turn-helix domain-containing protein [unclassified Paraburkholderia]MBB5444626.1 hypothetical protein [Paraburkholderia sp. WSM4177]MBB5485450.1 hypothetical protein [Paraburkholderia sp. WSM4180]
MSHHLVNKAMEVKIPGVRKWVLCVLAHQAVMSSGEAKITMAELAEICCLSTSCVRDHVKNLHRAGQIDAVLLRNSCVYRIRVTVA